MPKNRKISKKYIFYIFFPSLIFISFLLFRVNKISCSGNYGNCREKYIRLTSQFEGKNMLVSKYKLARELGKDSRLESFEIKFKLPNRLVMMIEEKAPVYAIFNKKQNLYILVDNEGFVVSIVDSSNLPIIEFNELLPDVGDKIDDNYLKAFTLFIRIDESFNKVKAEVNQNTLKIIIDESIEILFPIGKFDNEYLYGSFVLVYNEIKSKTYSNDGNSPLYSTIDLRYNNPVVR